MYIGLLSDTHGWIDDRILHHFRGVDEIWHAGDIGQLAVTDALAQVAPVRAVFGNIDDHRIRATFPHTLNWDCGGLAFAMTHIGGRPGGYARGVLAELQARKPGVFICGHSHILRIERDPSWGGLYLNPGAAGMHGFHAMRTLVRFRVLSGQIQNLEVIELGTRTGDGGRKVLT